MPSLLKKKKVNYKKMMKNCIFGDSRILVKKKKKNSNNEMFIRSKSRLSSIVPFCFFHLVRYNFFCVIFFLPVSLWWMRENFRIIFTNPMTIKIVKIFMKTLDYFYLKFIIIFVSKPTKKMCFVWVPILAFQIEVMVSS